ncbi:GNAT family N-acetyltransferase [Streptomyces sp. NBC_01304]|uniref:GNAT family N-acetyltransferase n=1 Tax=Streptomyces sp. NBC_01304 TaxID=2903818 RepID=UPI002E158951|nr:GNAT family N-acetyltransferase [Streptomyces sp. NBC_01304]
MSSLRLETVGAAAPVQDALVRDWQHVHNLIIPPHFLSLDDVRERSTRNHLEVAYLGDTLVGCSTVRPPTSESPAATVIARVLPAYRERGFGTQMYERGLARARELGAESIETNVLGSNPEGLRFAKRRGFVEIETYVLPGDTIPYIDLRLES